MKILLVNGSPHEHGCTYTALREIGLAAEGEGLETEVFWIGSKAVNGCVACRGCRDGHCVFGAEDGVNALIDAINASDGVVFGTPVHFAGPAGNLHRMLDRVFYAKRSFAGKPGAAIASCRRSGGTATFDVLNKYFTISSMPIVSSQYWNVVHGNSPEEVRRDEEGMQTMRTLGRNMAWLIKCIAAGKAAGVEFPPREAKFAFTNFIR